MESSRPVVVHHRGHLILTLDFQGQILKMLYLRNGRADWHGTKGIWVNRIIHLLCDFQLWPQPWPWPWIFKVKFWKSHISGMGWPFDMEGRDVSRLNVGPMLWLSTFTSPMTLTFDFQGQILKKLYLRNGMADWHGTIGMWVGRMLESVGPMLWLSTFTPPMTLTLDFQGQILKMLYLKYGRADWHGTKGMWVDRMLHPLCDFQLWPQPWPWPWIFKVKFWKSCISGMGWPFDMEHKDVSQ